MKRGKTCPQIEVAWSFKSDGWQGGAGFFFLTNHKAMFGKTKAIIDYFQHSIENAFQWDLIVHNIPKDITCIFRN